VVVLGEVVPTNARQKKIGLKNPWGVSYETLDVVVFPPLLQAILNNDETTHLLENLEPDTPYDVSVTAIYPDESESEDLLGTERTRKTHFPGVHSTASATIQATFLPQLSFL